jgi:hypothetical protein
MSASDVNLSIFFCGVSPMHLIPYPYIKHTSLDRTCSRVGTARQTGLELLPVHLREEAYSPLGRTIFQRVYCGPSPTWKLAEDPLPRLALFLVRQQALLVQV